MKYLVVLLFSCFALIATISQAETLRCPDVNAQVTSKNSSDAILACEAVNKTISFMSAQGFITDGTVKITISESINRRHSPAVYGLYSTMTNEIALLSSRVFYQLTRNKLIFGVEPDQTIYQSFMVHEIAHAIAQQNFSLSKPPLVAQEYIAYVVQLSTLPQTHLKRILDGFPFGPFEKSKEINSVYFSLSPENFAIKSYLHFQRPENGTSFVKTLLAKDILDRCGIRYNC